MTTLAQNRLQLQEHYCSTYAASLLDGQSIQDALEPSFWSHVATKLRQHDIIRIIPERGNYFAELIVVSTGRAFANVRLLRYVDLTQPVEIPVAESEDEAEAFEDVGGELIVAWKGPHVKFAVIRKSDGERLREGFDAKSDAEQWARDHISALAR